MEEIRLTQLSHGLGCGCKLKPQLLEEVLSKLPRPTAPALLVGAETKDDAAVWKLTDELAVVSTLDFFMPIVDDPYDFGSIAATNALSDIYAMGGTPLFALNIVGFPTRSLPTDVLERILKGASDKTAEAGVAIVGGHSVDDTEPKYGLAVTGVVHPDRVMKNCAARPGDALVLTKPIGTGIVTTAMKRQDCDEEAARQALRWMTTLNDTGSRAALAHGARAITDVTGFGLLGHLSEMSLGSGVNVELRASAVPLIPGARRLAGLEHVPGGSRNNLLFVAPRVDFDPAVSPLTRLLLADAQTSGGLLVALPPEQAEGLVADLRKAGLEFAALIGRFTTPGEGRIHVMDE